MDESGDDVLDSEMHEAEVEHDIGVVLWISPAVVMGHHRPASFSHQLNHEVLSLDKGPERGKLRVDVVTGRSLGRVRVVEKLHADYGKDIEDKQKKRHEPEDDRHNL